MHIVTRNCTLTYEGFSTPYWTKTTETHHVIYLHANDRYWFPSNSWICSLGEWGVSYGVDRLRLSGNTATAISDAPSTGTSRHRGSWVGPTHSYENTKLYHNYVFLPRSKPHVLENRIGDGDNVNVERSSNYGPNS